jgi:hypothetical protein
MITRYWHCTCEPIVAYGCGGRYELWLHGVDCKRPVYRRQPETRRRTRA